MPLFAIVVALLLSACSGMHSYKYKVGVSQCVGGKWREKVNDEMLSAQHLYGNEVKVSIKNANNEFFPVPYNQIYYIPGLYTQNKGY